MGSQSNRSWYRRSMDHNLTDRGTRKILLDFTLSVYKQALLNDRTSILVPRTLINRRSLRLTGCQMSTEPNDLKKLSDKVSLERKQIVSTLPTSSYPAANSTSTGCGITPDLYPRSISSLTPARPFSP